MNEQMQQELLNRLDLVAAKLGTTAAYLWEVLLQQARVEAFESFTMILVGMGLLTAARLRWTAERARAIRDHEDDSVCHTWRAHDWTSHIFELSFAIIAVLAVLGLILFTVGSCSIFTPLFNPEYWAFQELLRLMRGAL